MTTSVSRKAAADTVDNALPLSNTVAVIGLILVGVAGFLCAVMFAIADQLPADSREFRELMNNTPTQLRLLILGCSAGVLVVVAFVLCVVGLFLPNRPRLAATIGTTLSLLLMLGVFGVMIVGVLLNPAPDPPEPSVSPAVATDAGLVTE